MGREWAKLWLQECCLTNGRMKNKIDLIIFKLYILKKENC